MYRVGVVGASGYAGAQLMGLLNAHPKVETVIPAVQSRPGVSYRDLYPGADSIIDESTISVEELLSQADSLDVLFMALPHGVSMNLIHDTVLPERLVIVDLGADFRLNTAEQFKFWYELDHVLPDQLEKWIYGLPEWNRNDIKGCRRIANPGCYPTASLLALQPLLKNQLIHTDSIIIDAKSGVTGAGRSLNLGSLFCECSDSMKAYGVTTHRHTAEIEQTASAMADESILLNFTPHLIPMKRGILATVYGTLNETVTESALTELYQSFYSDEHFVRVRSELPETRWVQHSNYCDISVRVDRRTNRAVIVSAIDNLMKGAASQAVQNMNLALGLDETLGLNFGPIIP